MKSKKTYLINCVNSTARLIQDMVDNAREITFQTFCKHVDKDDFAEIKRELGYIDSCLKIQDDYAVSFYKSKYKGKECVYLCHSCIEYVFV